MMKGNDLGMKALTALIISFMLLLGGVFVPSYVSAASPDNPIYEKWYPINYGLDTYGIAGRPTDENLKDNINTSKQRFDNTFPSQHLPHDIKAVKYYKVTSDEGIHLIQVVATGEFHLEKGVFEAQGYPLTLVNDEGVSILFSAISNKYVTGGSKSASVPPTTQPTVFTISDYKNPTSIEEIQAGAFANIPMTDIYVTDITRTSANLTWKQINGVTGYRIRLTDPLGPDPAEVDVIKGPDEYQTYSILNLEPDKQYTAYVSALNGATQYDEVPVTFTTLSYQYNANLKIGNTQLRSSTTQYLSTGYANLEIATTDFTRFDLYVNNTLILTKTDIPTPYTINVPLEDYSSLIGVDGSAAFELRLYKDSKIDRIQSYYVFTELGQNPDKPGDLKPEVPTKPDSAWDLVGWLEYLVGWVIYIVESFVWLLATVGAQVQNIWNSSSGFIQTLSAFFGFLPPEVVTVMALGMSIAVLMRILGR